MEQAIICVDDDKFLVDTLAEQIRGWVGKTFSVEKALSGMEALELLDDYMQEGVTVPLFISDYIMPGMNGAEVLTEVHKRDKHIKTIMLTGYTAVEGIVSAINNASLYHFISKPWNNNDLMLTVMEALRLFDQEKKNRLLVQSFEKLYRGYEAQLDYWTKTLARVVDIKSEGVAGHSALVAKFSYALGKQFGMKADDLKTLKAAAFFHDVGRLMMQQSEINTIRAKEALIYDFPQFIMAQNNAAKEIFTQNPQFDTIYLKGILNHYEKFNGKGVNGLKGNDIPLEARIIGITNFYAALANPVNPSALSPSSAMSMIASLSNTIFDPKLVDAFAKLDLDALHKS